MRFSVYPVVFAAIAFMFLFSSCANRMVGTWTVQNYETNTQGKQSVSLKNIGTMTFNKNGTGQKAISYSVMGESKEEKGPFTWMMTDNHITINGEGSDLSKTWIRVQDKKSYQKWQATNGANEIQVLELKK